MATHFTQLFAPAQLTTSAATYYTMPSTPSTIVLINGRVRFTNTTSGIVTATAHAVQSGGSASDSNAFMKAESIPANSHVDVDVPVLAASGTLQALAGAATSITISQLAGILISTGP